jgi:hypothetical protein
VLVLHGQPPEHPAGRVVRMHRETVRQLRRYNPWRRGTILMMLYGNRPCV